MPPTPTGDSRLYKIFRGKHAEWMLACVATVESWFMPIVIEPFMVFPIITTPAKWFRLSTIVTCFSVFGGTLGYLTGMFFFDLIGAKLIALYHVGSYVEETKIAFNNNVFWVIFAGAFTPLPYKVFTLLGGFLRVNFFMFILASLVGRGLRFYAVGYVLGRFGERALPVFLKHLNIAIALVAGSIVLYALHSVL